LLACLALSTNINLETGEPLVDEEFCPQHAARRIDSLLRAVAAA
jgi:hypothetical protein